MLSVRSKEIMTSNFSKEQQDIIDNVYKLKDEELLSDSEKEVLKTLFSDPQMFIVLRKALQLFTPRERGLFLPNPGTNLTAADYEKLGIELRISRLVDERQRNALTNLYLTVKNLHQNDKESNFTKENAAIAKEAIVHEEQEETQEAEERPAGANL